MLTLASPSLGEIAALREPVADVGERGDYERDGDECHPRQEQALAESGVVWPTSPVRSSVEQEVRRPELKPRRPRDARASISTSSDQDRVSNVPVQVSDPLVQTCKSIV